jgi:hypothetical protein
MHESDRFRRSLALFASNSIYTCQKKSKEAQKKTIKNAFILFTLLLR